MQPTTTMAQTGWSLALSLVNQVEARPDKTAIIHGGRRLTFSDLDRRSTRVARGLAAEGVGAQQHVAFLDKNCAEYFEVLYGAGKLNAVDVAVNWRLAAADMEFVVNDARARVLFVGREFFGQLDQIRDRLHTVTKVVTIGEHPDHESYESWLARQDEGEVMVPAASDDVAMQLYTSGTTGMPKGAMLTNANLGAMIPHVGPRWNLDESSVNLVAMPLFHIGGSGWALVGMDLGVTTVVLSDPVPALVIDAIEQHHITNAFVVPALLNFMAQVPGVGTRDLSSLRSIVYGASPITVEALKRCLTTFRCDFIQVYGLTETAGAITELAAADHDLRGQRATELLRSAGRPFPWVDIRIVDPATGVDLPPGGVGELWIRSVQVMKGYWDREQDTAAAIVDGWFRSGDAGFMDQAGYVFVTDRIKDMILSGGENIYAIEVENALAAHPGVLDVAVIGVPDERWGETAKAIVVRRPGATVTAADVIAFARTRLGGYKCPTSVDFVEALPRNPSGKVLKRELREPYWRGQDRRVH
jgi:long-chain acyl-CoA synthetase